VMAMISVVRVQIKSGLDTSRGALEQPTGHQGCSAVTTLVGWISEAPRGIVQMHAPHQPDAIHQYTECRGCCSCG
jgi:hypothetical protein